MEPVVQEIYKAKNGKLFLSKEECVSYETRIANNEKATEILTFLVNEGFRHTSSNGPCVERYDGKFTRLKFTILGFDCSHIHIEKFGVNSPYTNPLTTNSLVISICDLETFKTIYKVL
jgi:hypothetical protein